MSTITFLPYIGEHFIKEYIIPNYIGESLSNLIPGVLGMIQKVGTRPEDCQNGTLNSSNVTTALNDSSHDDRPRFSVSVYYFLMFLLILFSTLAFSAIHFWQNMKRHRKVADTELSLVAKRKSEENQEQRENLLTSAKDRKDKLEIGILNFIIFVISFMCYGYLPGILSYSGIPYGISFLHLSINLSNSDNQFDPLV
jgi:hypothetical protein